MNGKKKKKNQSTLHQLKWKVKKIFKSKKAW